MTELALIRLALAFVFGAIIGVEREWRHKAAGIKTNTLVAIGSTTFALMTNTFGAGNHNPAQLAAAVVSGIGFIGAGVVIHRGASVQGVTTAATLWATASMGVAVGLGFYSLGALTFVGILAVQFGMRKAVRAVAKRAPSMRETELHIDCAPSAIDEITNAWRELMAAQNIREVRRSVTKGKELVAWRVMFVSRQQVDLTAFEDLLARLDAVMNVELRHIPQPDEEP